MEAIILAGGFGTRLKHVVSDVPKPMAPVNGDPFLKHVLDYLLNNGVSHIVLAVGYKADIVQNFFGDTYNGINISYSVEDSPLGTGGAIKKALKCCNEKNIFILNGDTMFDVDLKEMQAFHANSGSDLTIAIKSMNNFNRYGTVVLEEGLVTKFVEKKPTLQGKINGGIYLINNEIMNEIDEMSFSIEKMILESRLIDIYGFESDGYFIDIGVPEDYYKVQKDFEKNNSKLNLRGE